MSTARTLKTVIFIGSARNSVAPWGGDSRLGDRVLKYVLNSLGERKSKLGEESIGYDITVVDPLKEFAKDGALSEISAGELTTPTFFLKELPPKAAALQEKIKSADCYLIISPEYNHTVPPALSSIMGHFGGSNYKAKPSGIITYSSGPWGGMRAAMAIQVMCHELGCLPVSSLCGIPTVSAILEKDGKPKDASHRMLNQLPKLMDQLDWMAVAMANQRAATGAF